MIAEIIYTDELPDSSDFMKLFETTKWDKVNKADEKDFSKSLNNSWCVISAYCEGQLVGVGRVVSDGVLYAMIHDLIVNPSFQNSGIGDTVLSKLIEKCEDAGVRHIQLFSAKGKAPYYRKRGFVERPSDAPGMEFKKI